MIQLLDKKLTRGILATLLLTGGLSLSSQIYAIPSDRNQPITLEADRATFNEKTGVTTYTGNVVIQQGTLKVQAASIVAHLNANNKIQSVVAQGSPAKFQQQLDTKGGIARGEGRNINYNAETGIIKLSGNAFLTQNGATFRGENLTYSMSKGDIEANGGNKGRIQIVIPPSAQQNMKGVRD
ncbi:lipopolysaccharide transport periplasmic protein LptA [Acinetobacter qingfengensis]|uniref:Lipopolysaccharide export system protein LptA n=1 Tax=Acinetobacter qingfengensis TaxID=1262585 RepID=A0A1E7R6L6_9GAMM|nr:lipopolysaccharide transport periplasmic protein LptA [Acinetobacter qingfengensis]KAA8734683.1 lipopolysaccharide transport periplasmic protein LptA [Acinetobacter qingfengensis]OEY94952.1 lipopolysaccharide transport periplasmic protein LptA [Acinetobacter qingfengensis]